jgi:outer membrane lipoprotein-sorting protein
MNREKKRPSEFMNRHFTTNCIGLFAIPLLASAADQATEMAARLSAKQEGSSFVRVRMETGGGDKQTLQLQIKSRVSRVSADIVYQVLFPKERKGEAVLLKRSRGRVTGTLFIPSNSVRPIASVKFTEPLFGSDLSYEDIIDDPFGWDQQAIVGTEVVDGTTCQILESKPGKGHNSSYASVHTWVDPRRYVPLRIEKYDGSGKLVRQISTTRVLLEGAESVPANLSVRGPRGTVTEIDGSRLKRGVTYDDVEFTVDGLKQLSAPPGSPQ